MKKLSNKKIISIGKKMKINDIIKYEGATYRSHYDKIIVRTNIGLYLRIHNGEYDGERATDVPEVFEYLIGLTRKDLYLGPVEKLVKSALSLIEHEYKMMFFEHQSNHRDDVSFLIQKILVNDKYLEIDIETAEKIVIVYLYESRGNTLDELINAGIKKELIYEIYPEYTI